MVIGTVVLRLKAGINRVFETGKYRPNTPILSQNLPGVV